MVFGECGQGKSTTLTAILEIYKNTHFPNQDHGIEFENKESFKAVTSCVKAGSLGNMTLIDTPGLNDPDATRSDKNIFIEMIKKLTIPLNDPEQGISSLILCIMPNESQRITDSVIKCINSMFFMFNSLDDRIDVKNHPKYHIIINNVSKFGENYDFKKIDKDPNYTEVDTPAS